MSITVRILALLSVVSAASFILSGCTGEPASTPPPSMAKPPEELTVQEIASNTIYVSENITATSFDINTDMIIEIIGGPAPVKVIMLQDTVGYLNQASKEMEFSVNTETDIPDAGKENTSLDMYFVDQWAYMRTDVPVLGESWVKMKLTDELWASQSQFAQQTEFLKTATGITLAGSENINGIDCYILNIMPDMAELARWVLSQTDQQQTGVELSEQDLVERMKNTSMKEWVAKDSFLPMREDFDVFIEMLPGDFSNPVSGLEKATMNIATKVHYYDYNTVEPVVVPQEALDAPEVPSGL